MTTPLRQAHAGTSRKSPNAIVRLGRSWLGRVLRLRQLHGLHPRPRLARPGTGAAGDRVQRGYPSAASSRSSALSPTTPGDHERLLAVLDKVLDQAAAGHEVLDQLEAAGCA